MKINHIGLLVLLSGNCLANAANHLSDFLRKNPNPSVDTIGAFISNNADEYDFSDKIIFELKLREAEYTDQNAWQEAQEKIIGMVVANQESEKSGDDRRWIGLLGSPFNVMAEYCTGANGIALDLYATGGTHHKRTLLKVRVTLSHRQEYNRDAWCALQKQAFEFINTCKKSEKDGVFFEFFDQFSGIAQLVSLCRSADQLILCKVYKEKIWVDVRFYNQSDL